MTEDRTLQRRMAELMATRTTEGLVSLLERDERHEALETEIERERPILHGECTTAEALAILGRGRAPSPYPPALEVEIERIMANCKAAVFEAIRAHITPSTAEAREFHDRLDRIVSGNTTPEDDAAVDAARARMGLEPIQRVTVGAATEIERLLYGDDPVPHNGA